MTCLPRTTRIIVCTAYRAAAYGIARPALLCHDGTLHLDAKMSEETSINSQPIALTTSPRSTQSDLARSPSATTITKSP
jgi:hypothetical protein